MIIAQIEMSVMSIKLDWAVAQERIAYLQAVVTEAHHKMSQMQQRIDNANALIGGLMLDLIRAEAAKGK